jgi:hypothetical protein
MISRTAFVLCLDVAMLLLVCVLECIGLTGLTAHEWLGFALCPLVLIHVVMQWQWCVTQFRKLLTSSWRDRINVLLNGLLLVLMSAVLLSGVLTATQVTALVGESFGRMRIWHEVHGWLNFTLVVLVALHLALNWSWLIAAFRRRRPERPALIETPLPNTAAPVGRRPMSVPNLLGRGLVVMLVALLATAAVYYAMEVMVLTPQQRAELKSKRPITATATAASRSQLAPNPRSADFPDGLPQLCVTILVVLFAAIVGRYVFRLRL